MFENLCVSQPYHQLFLPFPRPPYYDRSDGLKQASSDKRKTKKTPTLHPFQHHIGVLPAAEELILADGRVQAGQAEMALVGDQAYPSASARRRTALARHFTHAFVNFFPNTIFSCFVCLLYGALSKIDGSLNFSSNAKTQHSTKHWNTRVHSFVFPLRSILDDVFS